MSDAGQQQQQTPHQEEAKPVVVVGEEDSRPADDQVPPSVADEPAATTAEEEEETPVTPVDGEGQHGGDGDEDASPTAAADDDTEKPSPAQEDAEADVNEEEEVKQPVRPATPQRTLNLRAELEAVRAKLAQRKTDLAAAKEALEAQRTRDEISTDLAAVQNATTEALAATEAANQITADSETACVNARAVGGRVKRYELFLGRVEAWVNNDLQREIEAGQKDRALSADRGTVEKLQVLKARRDEALANLAEVVDERGRNSEILRGATTNPPVQSPSRTGRVREQQQQQESARTTHRDPNSPTSAAADTARRGVLLSPGASRSGTVEPLPKQPSEAELASWDLEDYQSMNASAHDELSSIRDLRSSFTEERKARIAKNSVTKRKVEAELADLRYQQRHAQQDLKAKKKRVAELEQHNAALSSTLQYTQQSMKVAWAPVRESLLDRTARRSAVNTARSKHGGNTQRGGGAVTPSAQPDQEEQQNHQLEARGDTDGHDDITANPAAADDGVSNTSAADDTSNTAAQGNTAADETAAAATTATGEDDATES